MRRIAICGLAAFSTLAGCETITSGVLPPAEPSCGAHGRADMGEVTGCACDEGYTGSSCSECAAGYQDQDGDEVCLPDCATAGLQCASGSSCAVEGGSAKCVCDEDHAGATCTDCQEDLQDNDGDGECAPTCGSAGLACGPHGTCSDADGTAGCECAAGYAGDDCSACAAGLQDNDGDGDCQPACSTANVGCGDHGSCDDTSGVALCDCAEGYTGDDCSTCDPGMQDRDGDGVCHPSCKAANLVCGDHGACDDASGVAVCSCEPAYAGAQCETCASGMQDNDDDGECAESCAAAALVCGDFGVCEDASGAAECACDLGYSGPSCSSCAVHFQDHDSDGTCAPACGVGIVNCDPGKTCDDSSGTAECLCPAGYSGANCEDCATGYHDDDGDGFCRAPCPNAPWWNGDYASRVSLTLLNSTVGAMATGTHVVGDFDHDALVAQGLSQASGDDVRVVYFDGVNNVELARLPFGEWDSPSTGLIFDLMAPIDARQTSLSYWIYFNAPSAVNPPVLANPYAVTQEDDASKSLTCASEINAPYYSGQLRQVSPSLYQIHLYDQTHDPAAYVRVQITDVALGTTLKDTTYGSYGDFQAPGTFDEYVSIDSANFTVTMTSRESTGSVVSFGCEGFASAQEVIGTTTRSYVRGAINPHPEMGLCGP